jgi:hypothetical protein
MVAHEASYAGQGTFRVPVRPTRLHLGLVPQEAEERLEVNGASLSLLADRVGRLSGLQLSLALNLIDRQLDGVQVAVGGNIARGPPRGAQVAVGANASWTGGRGAQIGVGANLTPDWTGAQVAVGVNAAGKIEGVQLALMNLAADASGLQLGIANLAARSSGLQLGLVNFESSNRACSSGSPMGRDGATGSNWAWSTWLVSTRVKRWGF